jgi:hypothetical protein
MQKHKVTVRMPAEAVMTFVVESSSEAQLERQLKDLAVFADAAGATLVHRFDECTGADGEVSSVEDITLAGEEDF